MSEKKQKTKTSNIYFLFGEDHFRLNLALKALLQKFSHLPLKKLQENDDFQSTIWEVSFFAEEKLILLNWHDFSTNKINELTNLIESEDLPEFVHLILYAAGKMDKRLKAYKFLEKSATETTEIEQFSPWKLQDICKWTKDLATEREINIETNAVQRLVEFYTSDTASIASELEKLYCYTAGKPIKKLDIENLCQNNFDLFDLSDNLLLGQISDFINKFKKIAYFQNPLPIIAGLQTVFRNYTILKDLQGQGLGESEITKLTNKNPYKIKQDLIKLKNIKLNYLLQIIKKLNLIEEGLKTGKAYDALIYFQFQILSLNKFL